MRKILANDELLAPNFLAVFVKNANSPK